MSNKIELLNIDCLEYMRTLPDKAFELAITDPPYGDFGSIERTGGPWSTKYQRDNSIKYWDIAPKKEYFDELFRISKNQIIWGGNYFGLPPCRCFLIWKKLTISETFSMAMAEYAWTSFSDNAKIFECAPQNPNRFHPTQKPISLYTWILEKYAKQGDRIFDSHMGSGSSAIACYRYGFNYVGCEIDKDYYNGATKRLENEKRQGKLF